MQTSGQQHPGTTSNGPDRQKLHQELGHATCLALAIARLAHDARDGTDVARLQESLFIIEQLTRVAGAHLDSALSEFGAGKLVGDFTAWQVVK